MCYLCVVSADRDPSLEIKYRPKKTKEKEEKEEKEAELEGDDKLDGDGSSTPQPRTDRRRGSQVTKQQDWHQVNQQPTCCCDCRRCFTLTDTFSSASTIWSLTLDCFYLSL